jgi:hypothetical protein
MPDRHGRITNVLICEDIRQEVSNQNTLVGVYAGDVVVKEFPASIRIAIYAEYVIVTQAAHDVHIRISYQGESRYEIMEVTMKVPDSAREGIAFALPPTSLRISEKGALIVEVRSSDDGDWLQVVAKSVEKGAPASVEAQPLY